MRKLEKNSRKKQKARELYEKSDLSVRQIGRELKVDDKTVRNWAEAGKWERDSAPVSAAAMPKETIGEAASRVVQQIEISEQVQSAEPRTAQAIARELCGTIDVLRAELDTTVRNLRLLQEIAESDVDQDSERATAARRRLIAKVLDLPTLVKSANDLSAALSRLAEAGPGKKQERQENADKAASSGVFAAPAPPKMMMQ